MSGARQVGPTGAALFNRIIRGVFCSRRCVRVAKDVTSRAVCLHCRYVVVGAAVLTVTSFADRCKTYKLLSKGTIISTRKSGRSS